MEGFRRDDDLIIVVISHHLVELEAMHLLRLNLTACIPSCMRNRRRNRSATRVRLYSCSRRKRAGHPTSFLAASGLDSLFEVDRFSVGRDLEQLLV
jgi:hypothetical protein